MQTKAQAAHHLGEVLARFFADHQLSYREAAALATYLADLEDYRAGATRALPRPCQYDHVTVETAQAAVTGADDAAWAD